MKCKLYRYKDEEWKERATGYLKLLRHKETKRIRMIIRQDKIFKIRANFFSKHQYFFHNFIVGESPMCDLVQHQTNDRAYLWRCLDFSDNSAGIVEHYSCKF